MKLWYLIQQPVFEMGIKEGRCSDLVFSSSQLTSVGGGGAIRCGTRI